MTVLASNAQANIFLEKGKVNMPILPGRAVVDSLKVHNTSDEEMTVRAYWEDFEYQEPFDGSKKFSQAGTTSRSSSEWVNFSPREFVLGPYESRKIAYVINPPNDIDGGYYGVMFFERVDEENISSTGVKIVTRVGTLFFLETLDSTKEAEVSKIAMDDQNLMGNFENNGNVILIPEGVYYIMNNDGVVHERGEMDTLYLPPGKQADFNIDIDQKLPKGQHTLVMTFDLQQGDVLIREVDIEKTADDQIKILDIRN